MNVDKSSPCRPVSAAKYNHPRTPKSSTNKPPVILVVFRRAEGKTMVCITLHELASDRSHRINCILSGAMNAAMYAKAVSSLCDATKQLLLLSTSISDQTIKVPLAHNDIQDICSVKVSEFVSCTSSID
jgi:hypothetical protein